MVTGPTNGSLQIWHSRALSSRWSCGRLEGKGGGSSRAAAASKGWLRSIPTVRLTDVIGGWKRKAERKEGSDHEPNNGTHIENTVIFENRLVMEEVG